MTIRTVKMTVFLCFGVIKLLYAQELGNEQQGKASYYNKIFEGKPTSSGEQFNQKAFTAAHRDLPFNTMVEITNLANDKSVIVRINDRGPHQYTRIIDVSYAAAKGLGLVSAGISNVKLKVIGFDGKIISPPNDNLLKNITKWLTHFNPFQFPTYK